MQALECFVKVQSITFHAIIYFIVSLEGYWLEALQMDSCCFSNGCCSSGLQRSIIDRILLWILRWGFGFISNSLVLYFITQECTDFGSSSSFRLFDLWAYVLFWITFCLNLFGYSLKNMFLTCSLDYSLDEGCRKARFQYWSISFIPLKSAIKYLFMFSLQCLKFNSCM